MHIFACNERPKQPTHAFLHTNWCWGRTSEQSHAHMLKTETNLNYKSKKTLSISNRHCLYTIGFVYTAHLECGEFLTSTQVHERYLASVIALHHKVALALATQLLLAFSSACRRRFVHAIIATHVAAMIATHSLPTTHGWWHPLYLKSGGQLGCKLELNCDVSIFICYV